MTFFDVFDAFYKGLVVFLDFGREGVGVGDRVVVSVAFFEEFDVGGGGGVGGTAVVEVHGGGRGIDAWFEIRG